MRSVGAVDKDVENSQQSRKLIELPLYEAIFNIQPHVSDGPVYYQLHQVTQATKDLILSVVGCCGL